MRLYQVPVGAVIRRKRMERGMTQELLSGLAGIARTHLTMIENGPSELVAAIERELDG